MADTARSATAIHKLQSSCEESPYKALAYYYFNFRDTREPDAAIMLRCIIRQLCGCRPDTPTWLTNLGTNFRDKNALPGPENLERALWTAADGFHAVYLILDGLDEFSPFPGKREILMRSIVKLQGSSPPNVHILVTSRKEPDIEAAFRRLSRTYVKEIDLRQVPHAVNRDMDIYLQQKFASYEFDAISEENKIIARKRLLAKADGMYV
jgi:hypothetical protein